MEIFTYLLAAIDFIVAVLFIFCFLLQKKEDMDAKFICSVVIIFMLANMVGVLCG